MPIDGVMAMTTLLALVSGVSTRVIDPPITRADTKTAADAHGRDRNCGKHDLARHDGARVQFPLNCGDPHVVWSTRVSCHITVVYLFDRSSLTRIRQRIDGCTCRVRSHN